MYETGSQSLYKAGILAEFFVWLYFTSTTKDFSSYFIILVVIVILVED